MLAITHELARNLMIELELNYDHEDRGMLDEPLKALFDYICLIPGASEDVRQAIRGFGVVC